MNSDLTTAKNNINVLQSSVNTLNTEMDTAQSDILQNASDISDNANDISALQNSVTGINSSITGINSSLAAAQSDIATNANDIDSLESSVSALQSDLSDLSSDVDDIANDVTTNTNNIISIQSSVSSLSGETTDLQIDIADLQTDVSSMQSDIADLQTAIISAGSVAFVDFDNPNWDKTVIIDSNDTLKKDIWISISYFHNGFLYQAVVFYPKNTVLNTTQRFFMTGKQILPDPTTQIPDIIISNVVIYPLNIINSTDNVFASFDYYRINLTMVSNPDNYLSATYATNQLTNVPRTAFKIMYKV